MRLVECVPNFSEGRDPAVIDAIRRRIGAVAGVRVLDVSSDMWHHRTVVTFVAPPESVVDAAFAGVAEAATRIDLSQHEGAHPRIGATDVVPFVPLEGVTMSECATLARTLGERVGRELHIPVYLYEQAASSPHRENLANIRRGGLQGLRARMAAGPADAPDYGPSALHPSAGAVAIGARPILVAYNVYLGPSSNLAVAKDVARAVRASSGGLPAVKAIGLEVNGQAQVSMNLVNIDETPVHVAVDRVRAEAEARGVSPTWSELVGLMPERCLLQAGAHHLQLRDHDPTQLLERRISSAGR